MSTLAWIALTITGVTLYLICLFVAYALCSAAKRGDTQINRMMERLDDE